METESRLRIAKPLLGQENTTLDSKGRLLFPRRMRERLGEEFALSLNEYGCLVAMTLDAFYAQWEKITQADDLNPATKMYAREFMRYSADDLKFDKNGRVVVPAFLREAGGLESDVVLVGAGKSVEVWNAEELAKFEENPFGYNAERRERMEKSRRKMMGVEDE